MERNYDDHEYEEMMNFHPNGLNEVELLQAGLGESYTTTDALDAIDRLRCEADMLLKAAFPQEQAVLDVSDPEELRLYFEQSITVQTLADKILRSLPADVQEYIGTMERELAQAEANYDLNKE